MSAELAKVRYLQLPRRTAAAALAAAVLVGLGLLIFPPSDAGRYASTSFVRDEHHADHRGDRLRRVDRAGSMGGGIAAAFAFVFVLDGSLTQIPGLGDWTFGTVSGDVQTEIAGDGTAEHGLVAALLVTIAWSAVILAPGWLRLLRGDLK